MTGDLLAHNIDTAMWLNGKIDEVTAMTETFIKSRKHNLTGKEEPVRIDDGSRALLMSRSGRHLDLPQGRFRRARPLYL